MNGWRSSPLVAVVAICVFVVAQLLIPLSRFGEPERGQRFGWQMFSTYVAAPEFQVETDQGVVNVNLEDYMARARSDIDIRGLMPTHLCETIPGARSVTWTEGSLWC